MRSFLALCFVLLALGTAHADFATYYGGSDGYCGKRTARSGERYNCGGMTFWHALMIYLTPSMVWLAINLNKGMNKWP